MRNHLTGVKRTPVVKTFPPFHYAGHQPKASLLRLSAQKHRMATRLPLFQTVWSFFWPLEKIDAVRIYAWADRAGEISRLGGSAWLQMWRPGVFTGCKQHSHWTAPESGRFLSPSWTDTANSDMKAARRRSQREGVIVWKSGDGGEWTSEDRFLARGGKLNAGYPVLWSSALPHPPATPIPEF